MVTTSRSRRVFAAVSDLAPSTAGPAPPPTLAVLSHLLVPPLILPAFAALLAWEGHREVDALAVIAYTAGAATVYSGDRLLETDNPTTPRALIPRWFIPLVCTTVCAAILCLGAVIVGWPRLGHASTVLALMSLGYALLRRVPLLKTAVVATAWMLAIHVASSAATWSRSDVSVLLVIGATTVLCDLKDRERDLETAVVTVATAVGPSATRTFAGLVLVVAAGIAFTGAVPLLAVAAIAQMPPTWLRATSRPVIGSLIVDGTLVGTAAIAAAMAIVFPSLAHHHAS